jgi:hypothetical protein
MAPCRLGSCTGQLGIGFAKAQELIARIDAEGLLAPGSNNAQRFMDAAAD